MSTENFNLNNSSGLDFSQSEPLFSSFGNTDSTLESDAHALFDPANQALFAPATTADFVALNVKLDRFMAEVFRRFDAIEGARMTIPTGKI